MADVGTLEIITRSELRTLLENASPPVLSIYFPTERAAVEPEENSLHLKNLLGRASEELSSDFRRPQVNELLEPLAGLLGNREFWLHQQEGLALFRTAHDFRFYKLPMHVPQLVTVATSPYVRPLFPALFPEAHFYVLALSQNAVRLLHCSRHGAQQVDLERTNIPTSLEEALRFDDLQKPELKHHPTTGPGRAQAGQAPAEGRAGGREHAFHGHGESGEGTKTQLRRFFQAVNAGLSKVLKPNSTPMIIAGVDYVRALYREVSDYPATLEDGVDGSPDRLSDGRLHELALAIVEQRLQQELEDARDRYKSLEARDLASSDLPSILGAAHTGRIDTLFLRNDAITYGTFDPTEHVTQLHDEPGPDHVDLLDLAARQTFLQAGAVYVLDSEDMVDDVDQAAIYRY